MPVARGFSRASDVGALVRTVSNRPSRRSALKTLGTIGAATLIDSDPVLAQLAAQHPCSDPGAAGTLIATLPLFRADGVTQPTGVKFGSGLDARLITDLSALQPDRLITANAHAFVRTERPPAAASHRGPWTIRTTGLLARDGVLSVDDLRRDARHMGPHLFECSGNNNPANFGLISVADWTGVPLAEAVSRLQPASGATAVLISGMDYETTSTSSTPGASWVFPLADLDRLGAFLAVTMNGEPVPRDHGAPVRLVVPGWYACAWIKWVDGIRLVGGDEPATSQMKEFAARTHQRARHDLARNYTAAEIQTAATPIRVEKRRGPAGLEYRIVGIVWGGSRLIDHLAIRFGRDGAWNRFPICPAPATQRVWSLWEYRWKVATPGVYSIALSVPDSSVPQRRLESGYYMRQVRIDEV
jgi:DMSO/TMAO reductase YedYZ molybdopterin-dependent catalytic subunit